MNKDLQIELLKKDVSFKDKEIDRLEEELSLEKDKVLELSNHLALYSSEETMFKEINDLKSRIDKAVEYIENDTFKCKNQFQQEEYDYNLLKILKGEE